MSTTLLTFCVSAVTFLLGYLVGTAIPEIKKMANGHIRDSETSSKLKEYAHH
jgi:hypothetical protein